MRKWLYCILLTAMVLPMVSCRRAVEKARRNIRLEAVEKGRTQGDGRRRGRSAREERHGVQLVLERAKVDLFYAGSRVMSIILHGRVEVPRRTTGKFHVAVAREDYRPDGLLRDGEKIREDDISQVAVSFAVEGAGAGFGKKFGRDGAVVGIFEYLWAVLAGRENYLDE